MRYARFRVQARIAAQPFPDGASFVAGGAWRGEVYGDAAAWPASRYRSALLHGPRNDP